MGAEPGNPGVMALAQERCGKLLVTEESDFQAQWNPMLETMTAEEAEHHLFQLGASAHHPNPNMVWLHERLLYAMARVPLPEAAGPAL